MKTIGLLGGMSWESTLVYYRELNRTINQHLGGLHSAQIIMSSVDFAPLETMMLQNDWSAIERELIGHAQKLQQAGADCLVIATNTMHKLAQSIDTAIEIPLIHIADAVGKDLQHHNKNKIGLLGTRFTMEENFYSNRLKQTFNIDTVIPEATDRMAIDRIIFDELCRGKFLPESRQRYLEVIDKLNQQGAQAIILGCTEIGLLINQQDTSIPLFDATFSHIKAASQFALQ